MKYLRRLYWWLVLTWHESTCSMAGFASISKDPGPGGIAWCTGCWKTWETGE